MVHREMVVVVVVVIVVANEVVMGETGDDQLLVVGGDGGSGGRSRGSIHQQRHTGERGWLGICCRRRRCSVLSVVGQQRGDVALSVDDLLMLAVAIHADRRVALLLHICIHLVLQAVRRVGDRVRQGVTVRGEAVRVLGFDRHPRTDDRIGHQFVVQDDRR
uniref:Putative secreted protein n=1 Tax=Anopheles marajoara TaxID=58244 RepID=A0A2M4C650_9DIPT